MAVGETHGKWRGVEVRADLTVYIPTSCSERGNLLHERGLKGARGAY